MKQQAYAARALDRWVSRYVQFVQRREEIAALVKDSNPLPRSILKAYEDSTKEN